MAAARPAGADLQAALPDRGRQRADRRRARAARPRRAAALRDRRGSATGARRRGRRPSAYDGRPVLRGVDLAARARATASRSSASTARARRRSIRLLAGELEPDAGVVERGATVRARATSRRTRPRSRASCACSSRSRRCAAARRSATGARSRPACCATASASAASEARTLVRDLSGGERRRLQLMRLLMDEPNVLLLDEPTNDLDIDTLTALEDLLDGWPGTLVVVSHDRYFVERVCDDVYALTGDGGAAPPARRDRAVPASCAARPRRPAAPRRRRAEPRRRARRARCCARRARRSRGSSARSRSSASARRRCTRRWPRSATDHARLRELQAELEALARRARGGRGGVAGAPPRRWRASAPKRPQRGRARARAPRRAASRTSASPARSSGSPTSTGIIESCSSESCSSASADRVDGVLDELARLCGACVGWRARARGASSPWRSAKPEWVRRARP